MRHYSLLGLSALFLTLGVAGCSTESLLSPTQEPNGEIQSTPSVQSAPNATNTPLPPSKKPGSSSAIQAGQCWVYAQIKPLKVEDFVEITLKDSSAKISVTPAEIRQGYQQVVTREGTKTYRIEPPTYKKVIEQVMIQPEMTRFVVVPAVYETQHKVVVTEEAKTVLEPCQTAGTRYSKGTGARGFCAKEIPAVTQNVAVQVLKQSETTRVEFEPARYKEVVRWVVDQPARAVEVAVAPSIADVPVQEVVRPEQTQQTVVPAVTQALNVTRFQGNSQLVSRQAVCDTDMSPEFIRQVQQSLQNKGYAVGSVDGMLGERTLSALSNYQANNGLAIGAFTFETLQHLDIRY